MLTKAGSVHLILGIVFLLAPLSGCVSSRLQTMDNTAKLTPLIKAAAAGNLVEVEALLAKDGDINAKDLWGETALHKAAYAGTPPSLPPCSPKGRMSMPRLYPLALP
jgi:hypothetical protein